MKKTLKIMSLYQFLFIYLMKRICYNEVGDTMLEKFKKLFRNKKKIEPIEKEVINKEIIICIHGFGRRLEHEYDNFKFWNQDKYQLKTFNIYNLNDPKDNNPTIWIKRCEGMVDSYINAGYQVSLVGFSMGGVIATHLASMYPIKRLFLIAPAFDYLHVGNLVNTAVNKIMKTQNKIAPHVVIPSGFTSTFTEVVRLCKEDISKVSCPICFVHGDKDETIPLRSSVNAYDKVAHDKKKLFIIHEGRHRMMLHESSAWETWQLFNLFMDHIILGEKPDAFAKDIFAKDTPKIIKENDS
ncbi:MAG: carboxylesterase [Erysipelotrichia bacterium]|nr:carboxylesterase [Erysipelotrichia bacterium]NCC54860.1 carboxylesterase [Erysipelotrichia bacterium]